MTTQSIYDENEIEIELPTKHELCRRCGGKGHHSNPSIDAIGISAEVFDDMDEDFRADYFNEKLDVTCYECKGNKVVDIVDWLALTPHQCLSYIDCLRDEADTRAAEAAERGMAC